MIHRKMCPTSQLVGHFFFNIAKQNTMHKAVGIIASDNPVCLK